MSFPLDTSRSAMLSEQPLSAPAPFSGGPTRTSEQSPPFPSSSLSSSSLPSAPAPLSGGGSRTPEQSSSLSFPSAGDSRRSTALSSSSRTAEQTLSAPSSGCLNETLEFSFSSAELSALRNACSELSRCLISQEEGEASDGETILAAVRTVQALTDSALSRSTSRQDIETDGGVEPSAAETVGGGLTAGSEVDLPRQEPVEMPLSEVVEEQSSTEASPPLLLTNNFSSLTRQTVEVPAYFAFHDSGSVVGCGDLERNRIARPYQLRVLFDFTPRSRSIQIKLRIATDMKRFFLARRGLPDGASYLEYVLTFPLLTWPQDDRDQEIRSFRYFSPEPYKGIPNIKKFDKGDLDDMKKKDLMSLSWLSDLASGTPEIKQLPDLIRQYERKRVFNEAEYDHIRLASGVEAFMAAVERTGGVQLVVPRGDLQEEELRYLQYCSERFQAN